MKPGIQIILYIYIYVDCATVSVMAPCQTVEKILCDQHTCMRPFDAEKYFLQQTWPPVQYFEHVTLFGPVTKVHASATRTRVISRQVFTDHYREITN